MSGSPIRLTLYDPETNEVKAEFVQMFIPWGIMKSALKMMSLLDLKPENMSEEDLEKINGLICTCFGNRFTPEDLERYATQEEVWAVMMAIVNRIQTDDHPELGGENPTLPGPKRPRRK